jgi:hypothetical protein
MVDARSAKLPRKMVTRGDASDCLCTRADGSTYVIPGTRKRVKRGESGNDRLARERMALLIAAGIITGDDND